MFRAIVFAVSLLTVASQAALAQGNSSPKTKSVGTATKFSAYGTIIPIVAGGALMLAPRSGDDPFTNGPGTAGIMIAGLGITVGPGLGHAYAGRWSSLAEGTVLRTLGVIMIASGLIGDDPSGMGCWGKPEGECKKDEGTNGLTVVIGSAIYLWSTIHDFRTLDDSVERYNRKHARTMIHISPTYYASDNAPGIVLSLNF